MVDTASGEAILFKKRYCWRPSRLQNLLFSTAEVSELVKISASLLTEFHCAYGV
jgi:hypothetical protein